MYLEQIKFFLELSNAKLNKDRGFISVNILNLLTKEQLKVPADFDKLLKEKLVAFEQKHYLKDTVVIILSDHGATSYRESDFNRFGILEYYNPFLSIQMPDFLVNTFWGKALKSNKHKMITSFDLHKTLKHIYVLNKYGLDKNAESECQKVFSKSDHYIRPLRGVSLFSEIPAERSCKDALIPVDFCLCEPDINTEISENNFIKETSLTFRTVGQAVVDKLNDKPVELKKLCQAYSILNVHSVKKMPKSYSQEKLMYEIQLSVEPGPSTFNTDIEVKGSTIFVGQIIRENGYGIESSCLTNGYDTLRYQCFCKQKYK